MQISDIELSKIKSYKNNARKHPKKQISALAESIKIYGFNQPILIDRNNVIICGHGRVQAAKQLGLKEIPCIFSDGLTDEQIQQFRLVDNQISALSTFDNDLLKFELAEIDIDFDMGVFGFDIAKIFEEKPDNYKQTKNLDNFFKADIQGDNEWGIPETNPCNIDLSGVQWLSFGEKASIKNPENIALHFYIDDYKFNTLWENPDKYIDLFRGCKAVITCDFSNYADMPKAQQLWSHYKRQWLGKYWQDNGVNIISSLSWANGQIYDWSFSGIPEGTTVALSFVGDNIDKQKSIDELRDVINSVKPSKIYIKANKADQELLYDFDCEFIQPYLFKTK